jgi:hypothetical protein
MTSLGDPSKRSGSREQMSRRPGRAVRAAAGSLMLLGLLSAAPNGSIARAAAAGGRVVVLGFDGADARLVEQWMSEGKLPNLARLRSEGSYAPLLPTNPARPRLVVVVRDRDQPGPDGSSTF